MMPFPVNGTDGPFRLEKQGMQMQAWIPKETLTPIGIPLTRKIVMVLIVCSVTLFLWWFLTSGF